MPGRTGGGGWGDGGAIFAFAGKMIPGYEKSGEMNGGGGGGLGELRQVPDRAEQGGISGKGGGHNMEWGQHSLSL